MQLSMIMLGALAAFAAVALLAYSVQDYLLERREVYRSLRSVRAVELSAADLRHRELATPVGMRVVLPGFRRLGEFVRRFTPVGVTERLSKELAYAGSPAGWDAERVLALKIVGIVVLGTMGFAASVILAQSSLRTFGITAVSAVLGWYLPEWVVRSRASQRQTAISRALPDALDLMSITVEAGLGFDAALNRVSREMGGPLGEEFYRVVQEIQLGSARIDAMRGLSDRTNVPSLRDFVLAMIQADIFGISVAKVLAVQANEMRIRRRQDAEERAQKVPVKMIFPLIMCILPATFVVLAGPAVLRIADFFFAR